MRAEHGLISSPPTREPAAEISRHPALYNTTPLGPNPGDDIGYWNISRYSNGQMGYRIQNIDRIGEEGIITFTDYYGQQSCNFERMWDAAQPMDEFESGD
jgi:hypothetical protein